jgi:hypothetical protein
MYVGALVGAYGIAPDRLVPEGVDTAPPVDRNVASSGTNRNRRVERVAR